MRRWSTIVYIVILSILIFNVQSLAQQPNRAQKILDSVMNLVVKEKNDSIRMGYSMWIARLKMGSAQNSGKWNEAIEWWKKALDLAIKTKNDFCIGRCNMFMGKTFTAMGSHPEALKCFYAALNVSFKSNNRRLATAAYTSIADEYNAIGKYDDALKNYKLGYDNQKPLNDGVPEDIRQIAGTITGVYTKLKNWDEALSWYQKTLPYDSEISYEGQHELQLASIQMEMKNYDEALKNYRAGLKIYPQRFKREEMTYNGLKGLWYLELGDVYFKVSSLTKDDEKIASLNEAKDYLNKSLPLLSEDAGGKESLMKAYDLLKQVCEAQHDYENAIRYSNLYLSIKDSIYSKENYAKISDLRIKYETDKATAELKNKQAIEKAIEEQKVEKDKALAQQKANSEKNLAVQIAIAEQKSEKDIAVAQEKATSDKNLAIEKAKQEKLKAEKQQANNLLLLGLISVTIIALFLLLYLRQRQLKKRANERTESVHKMAELEMQSLRSQLNPHFMFNSLNSIQTLILKEDSDKSHSYLSRFARLLRMLLENAEKPFVPLQKEIDFLQLYLSLESLRVPDLQYSISTDPKVNPEQTLIPNMILQPYVENAIWHGLSYKETDKQLQIRINRDNGTIKYEVEDNGVGRKKAEELKSLFRKQHQSKGMELLNKRFKLLNGEYNSSIETNIADVIKNNEVAGTLVTIKVPVSLSLPSQFSYDSSHHN